MSDTEYTPAPEADTSYPIETYVDAAPAEDAVETLAPEEVAVSVPEPVEDVAAEAVAADPAASETKARAAASDLEGDLRVVLNDFVTGALVLGDGVKPTPHTLARAIAEKRGDGKDVSSGAVSAALNRWAEVGYITLDSKPMAFGDFTDDGRAQGLSALKAQHRAAKAALRAGAKAAAAPAPAPAVEAPVAEVSAEPVPEPGF